MNWRRAAGSVLITGILLAACSREEPPPPPKPKAAVPRAKNFQSAWQDESQYIVTLVASDLAEMAYYAGHRKPLVRKDGPPAVEVEEVRSDPRGLTYRVKVQWDDEPGATCDLPMTGAIWAPATYRPLTKVLFEKMHLGGSATPGSPDRDLLRTLTEPTAAGLTRIDRELSGELQDAFTAPGGHERAALLLGAFALRESSGMFFHLSFELSRMTAHLAFAEALRGAGEPSLPGRMADALLTLLYHDQAGALARVAALPDDETTAIWKRALRTRATADYRISGENEPATLLEKTAWFYAWAQSIDATRAWEKFHWRKSEESLPDWSRMAYAVRGRSVQLGHRLLEVSLDREMQELGQAYQGEEGRELPKEEAIEALNVEPARCVTTQPDGSARVRILGWGLWADFQQRHLCHVIAAGFDFMENQWGVPRDAAKYRDEMDAFFGGLRLYPFVRRQMATETAYYHQAQDEEMALVRRSPHLVPSQAWNYIGYVVPFGPIYYPPPHPFINEWHKHNPPPGTAYDPFPRMNHPSLVSQSDVVARLERMHALAPYDTTIDHNLLRIRDGDDPSAKSIEEVYGPVMDYDPWPNYRLSEKAGDPVTREKWLRRAAAIAPHYQRLLAEFYLLQQREGDAALAYQHWIETDSDDVAISNQADWLIAYYERTGKPDQATALADRAAGTYSARGLQAKASLLERRGELEAAWRLLEKQAERYDSPGALIGFLLRRPAAASPVNQERYAERLAGLLQEYHVAGLTKFARPPDGTAPNQGVLVHTESTKITDAGLKEGDVVVAVRGYAALDWPTFKAIRELEPNEPYALVVWRAGRYRAVGPLPAGYRFGIDLTDYKK